MNLVTHPSIKFSPFAWALVFIWTSQPKWSLCHDGPRLCVTMRSAPNCAAYLSEQMRRMSQENPATAVGRTTLLVAKARAMLSAVVRSRICGQQMDSLDTVMYSRSAAPPRPRIARSAVHAASV